MQTVRSFSPGATSSQTPEVPRVVLTLVCLAADAEVHSPVEAGLIDESVNNLAWERGARAGVDRLVYVDLDDAVFGEVDEVVAVEEQLAH